MKQQNYTSLAENKERKSFPGLPLLLLLLLLALVTSGIVGFILGNNSEPPSLGQIIDTILLTPDLPSAGETIHLTGRVFYTDGTPAASRSLELHSDPLRTVTNSDGGFLFSNVPEGQHTIYVRNSDGTAAAQKELEIVRDSSADTAVSVDMKTGGGYIIELSIDVRILEIEIELDNDTLFINPDRICYEDRDGMVTTPAGTASIRDGVIVTPGGNVYLPDGNVVLPGGGANDPTYIILTDDTVLTNRQFSAGGINVSADGMVTLPDGTAIHPGGVILTPDGETEMTGQGGVIVGDGIVTPIGSGEGRNDAFSAGMDRKPEPSAPSLSGESDNPVRPDIPVVPAESTESNTGQNESSPIPGTSVNPDASGVGGEEENPGGQEGSGDGGGSIPEDSDKGSLHVEGEQKDGGYISWEQNRLLPVSIKKYQKRKTDTYIIPERSSRFFLSSSEVYIETAGTGRKCEVRFFSGGKYSYIACSNGRRRGSRLSAGLGMAL